MTEHYHKSRLELLGSKFNASDLRRRDNIPGHANTEKITESLIEDDLDRDPGI